MMYGSNIPISFLNVSPLLFNKSGILLFVGIGQASITFYQPRTRIRGNWKRHSSEPATCLIWLFLIFRDSGSVNPEINTFKCSKAPPESKGDGSRTNQLFTRCLSIPGGREQALALIWNFLLLKPPDSSSPGPTVWVRLRWITQLTCTRRRTVSL